ncbi:MAG: hypothetical protein ACTSSG_14060 [Candidatus Heimdallarchaeaceae archaeon]
MGRTTVKAHIRHRNGKVIHVKAHKRKTVGSKAKGRSGKKFQKLSKKITKEYIKRGFSKKKAEYIGKWQKFGKRKGSKILKRER